MEAHDPARLSEELLALTREMLALAQAGEWSSLAGMQERRQQLAHAVFAEPIPPEVADTVSERVRQVLRLDGQLVPLVEAERQRAVDGLQESNKGLQAASAYRRFAG